MTTREKRLTALVAAAGALWAGSRGISSYRAALNESDGVQIAAVTELETARTAANRGHHAQRKLSQWRRESLPTDADVAESLYRDWLSGELKAAGLASPQVSERTRAVAGEQATELTFTVTAQGELPQWLDFFRRFAAAPHLHRISETNIAPGEDRKKLTGTLRVDALSLADCSRQGELASAKENAAPDEAATQQIAAITARTPFEPFDAKQDKPEDKNGASQALVSGMFGGRQGMILTVRQQDSGKVQRYAAGDTVKFGSFEAKLLELDGRRVVYETPEGKFEVQLGQTFGDGRKVEDDA
ncbi:MAG: hypothetical protein KDA44_21360 [Planctomycetales bacterium]|nr:hypothetical protein [Planctomycetales bacterium]